MACPPKVILEWLRLVKEGADRWGELWVHMHLELPDILIGILDDYPAEDQIVEACADMFTFLRREYTAKIIIDDDTLRKIFTKERLSPWFLVILEEFMTEQSTSTFI